MIHLKVLVSEVVYPVKIRYEPIYVRGLFLHPSEYIKKRGFFMFSEDTERDQWHLNTFSIGSILCLFL